MKIACMYPGPGNGLYATVEANVKRGLGEDIEFKHFNADYSILFPIIEKFVGVMQQKHKDDLTELFGRAIAWGPDAIVCTCSSIGAEADRIALENPDVKIFRIDYPMARKAVDGYDNIAVMATLATTVTPSVELVEKVAKAAGKEVKVSSAVASGAFQKMMAGEREEAIKNVVETATDLVKESGAQILVLAQASMAAFQEAIQAANPDLVILNSPATLGDYIAKLYSGEDTMEYRKAL